MRFLVLIIGALIALNPQVSEAKTAKGTAKVVDGDTLKLGKRQIRLEGIDAPEHDQICLQDDKPYPCGKAAVQYLRRLAHKKVVRCELGSRDKYGRWLGICYAGEKNLNELMVREGYAVAFTEYSDIFVGAEQEARRAERGLWGMEFLRPRQWRHPLP